MRLYSRWETSDLHSSSNNKQWELPHGQNNATIGFTSAFCLFMMLAIDVLARMRTNNLPELHSA